ncbi:protein unc-13 homolog [Andrographis paniculata]|uniref:protein unc-13 homolog n=1 Tax=Andrographis paniculata TaxID=175694 RepID=UPI0021E78E96|nr:protein unc-13 homolog [Andrographis paniculata]
MGRRNIRVSIVKPDLNSLSTSSPRRSAAGDNPTAEPVLASPFGEIAGLDRDDFREVAYEVFFTACRSSPGFSGRTAAAASHSGGSDSDGPGSPAAKMHGVGMAVRSRVKTALGLKMMKRSLSMSSSSSSSLLLRRVSSSGMLNPSSPTAAGSSPRLGSTVPAAGVRLKRPMTSAEIMRQQMRVTEQSDNRLRKTLTRTLVGQMGRRAETIILPLELLRHVKPSEFTDPQDYHQWQRRQLRLLHAGLLLHPSIPLPKSNPHAAKLREILRSSEAKPIDRAPHSRTLKALCDCVAALACRGPDDAADACRWADGYPLNVHIYMALLRAVFDAKDETSVLDEVDELLELMKKTWSTLGFTRAMHNLCFAWVLFEQFVATGQGEPDLLGAAFVMLKEVENDAKNKADREPVYMKMLGGVLAVMRRWSESRLLDYHSNFNRDTIGIMENMLPLLSWSSKILEEDVPLYVVSSPENGEESDDVAGNRVDHCIRSSLRNAFAKILEEQNGNRAKNNDTKVTSEILMKMAAKTEELAGKESDIFSHVLKKWSPSALSVATVTLHTCYGIVLKQFLAGKTWQMHEILSVLQRTDMLEKALVEMAIEDSKECDDGGKVLATQMVPYEVDSIVTRLLKQWVLERQHKGKELLHRAKQTETWNPRSKTEPYAHSAVELLSFAKEAVDNFFQLAVNVSENQFYDFIDGLESLFLDYVAFISSCGSKQNYLPTVPAPTRCSRDSKFFKLWKKAACGAVEDHHHHKLDLSSSMDAATSTATAAAGNNHYIRAPTSRGTQRLYIRLNTLHHLSSQLHSLDKSLSSSPNVAPLSKTALLGHHRSRSQSTCSYFEKSLSALQSASQHVSEVAAYRLIFLDSHSVFYGGLYVRSVSHARVAAVIDSLKHNLTLLCMIVVERAQPLALKEVIKAAFEAFVRVLVTGGSSRMYSQMDHPMIEEDLDTLKRLFCMCGEGLVVEDTVEREVEAAQGVVGLMGQSTEQLIEDFISVTNGSYGMNVVNPRHKIPVPPTTGNWNRFDPNTILRVLCSRNDRIANDFLKKTLHLAKRRATGFKML